MIGKDLEQSLNHSCEEPTSIWLQGKGRLSEMILGIQDTRLRANTKTSVTGPKKLEVISSLFHTLTLSFPLLWWSEPATFFPKILQLVREPKLPAPGFYILKKSPIMKEKIEDIRVQGCSLNNPPQITCAVLDQPSWQGHGVLWLALPALGVWPSSTHDCQFPPELHDWSWGEEAERKWLGDGLGHERVCDDPSTPLPPHSEEL